ncbi:MAG: bifunctional phosphoribosyl-AMP cyclohydrolase/phosphoribosyl-ATP diphosphatase HisIE [Clostridiales bacterium]|nr:bifunctional phosphoribosyl-AMP cyclohydrolase/phosphoribosyl-ATP diphosphatase HisIE [Clostridiales bacterium]
MELLKELKFDKDNLIPAITQDVSSGEVLMMAWMNKDSLKITIETGYATYFSRSRNELWKKGETSGNLQKIISMKYDCDGDSILLIVEQTGPACHTGENSCFFNTIVGEKEIAAKVLDDVYKVIINRRDNPKEGSYTNYLLDKGIKKTCKKVGEEASEVIIGAISGDINNIKYETADLLYHLSVLLVQNNLSWTDVFVELEKRR